MQDFISKESETSVFIEAKAVALIYCLIKKNDTFHLSEMRKQELHYPPPLCFAMQNIGEVARSDGGVENTDSGGNRFWPPLLLLITDEIGGVPAERGD